MVNGLFLGLEADHVFLAGFDFDVEETVRAFDLDVRMLANGSGVPINVMSIVAQRSEFSVKSFCCL